MCKGQYYDLGNVDDECYNLIKKVKDAVRLLNDYNILEPCYHDPSTSTFDIGSLPPSFLKLGETERPLKVRKRMFGRAWPLDIVVRPGIVPSWPQILADSSVGCIVSTYNVHVPETFSSLMWWLRCHMSKIRLLFVLNERISCDNAFVFARFDKKKKKKNCSSSRRKDVDTLSFVSSSCVMLHVFFELKTNILIKIQACLKRNFRFCHE